MNNLLSFQPIINQNSKILILGSMPGAESLAKGEYYANPRNQFWKIIYSILGFDVEEIYKDRLNTLLKHSIALWDVLQSCDRDGSLDTNIRNEVANDFDTFLKQYPNIRFIGFNGDKAYKSFDSMIGFEVLERLDKDYAKLQSTSPANARKIEVKLANWEQIKEYM